MCLFFPQAEYQQSASTFEKHSERHPFSAEVWNNWAYALKAQACDLVALKAAQCAQRLAPTDQNYQSTLNDMQAALRQDSPHCPRVVCGIQTER